MWGCGSDPGLGIVRAVAALTWSPSGVISHCPARARPLSSLALNFHPHHKGCLSKMISEVLSMSVQLSLKDGVLDRQTDRIAQCGASPG